MFAIVEFGSAVRGSNDVHSDRDLLIVCERRSHRALRQRYEANGYSVSTLTPGQLNAMQKRGSLFIQHLKFESTVLLDFQGHFQSWLSQCKMVTPTAEEIDRCSASIEFLYNWPNDPRLIGWKADAVYCVSRDFFIKYLAVQSKLVFGLDDIHNTLKDIGFFKNFDMYLLNGLREAKASYRAGKELPQNTEYLLNSLLEYLASWLGLPKITDDEDSVESHIMSLDTRQFNSAYEQLRSLEAAYLIVRSQGMYHPAHLALMKIITAPNAYGSAQIRKKREVGEYLADVVAMLTIQGHKPICSMPYPFPAASALPRR